VPRRKTEPASGVPQTQTPAQTDTKTVVATAVKEAPAAEAKAEPKNITVKGEQLAGKALLDRSLSVAGKPIDEVARACGFYKEVTNRETGETKVTILTTDFMAAMLKAQSGIEFAPPARSYSRRTNRAPVVTVGGNGNIVIGNRYSSVAGFGPASKVHVEAVEGKITITVYEGTEDEEVDNEIDEEGDDLDL
jgi:hypothetical protein